MAEPKTKPTKQSVAAFIAAIDDAGTRRDCRALVAMMRRVTGSAPKMWGPSIVGFGTYRYVYASGREGDWPIAAFSPRRQSLTVYLTPGFTEWKTLLSGLGPHKTAKVCLYLRRLADVDRARLERLVRASVKEVRRRYPTAT